MGYVSDHSSAFRRRVRALSPGRARRSEPMAQPQIERWGVKLTLWCYHTPRTHVSRNDFFFAKKAILLWIYSSSNSPNNIISIVIMIMLIMGCECSGESLHLQNIPLCSNPIHLAEPWSLLVVGGGRTIELNGKLNDTVIDTHQALHWSPASFK